jgi:TrmH family RNA methyltransferase
LRRLTEFERLQVVLVSTRNPLNMGAAARAMSNFGFAGLRVVNPFEEAFREARSALGGRDVLAKAQTYPGVAEAVEDCSLVIGTTTGRDREIHHPLRKPEEGAPLIRARLKASKVAILFGSEKRGLSNDDLSHCHWSIRIPTREAHGSMNLGQAVAIVLYELARRPLTAKAQSKIKPARSGDVERITQLLLEALSASGYTKPGLATSTKEKVRGLVRRLQIPAEDAQLWMGILRQVLWKMRDSEPS